MLSVRSAEFALRRCAVVSHGTWSPATFDDAAADFLLVACAKAGGPCDFSGVISNADADAVTEIALE